MNRRQFVKSTSFAAVMSMFAPAFLRGASEDAPYEFELIRKGVGYFRKTGGTIGWMIDPECFTVVDTQFRVSATQFIGLAQEKAVRELDLLFNTHHHGDHTNGNSVIAPLAKQTVAHRNCVLWQVKSSNQPEEEVCATTVFDTSMKFDLPSETITATYYGKAHTCGDIVIHFANADVAHVGDLVFNHCPLFIDRGAGANIVHWMEVLETLHDEYSDNTRFIFGHAGDEYSVVGGRKDLLVMRDFLSGILDFTEKSISNGESKETLMKNLKLPGFEEYYLDSWKDAIPNALGTAYDELQES